MAFVAHQLLAHNQHHLQMVFVMSDYQSILLQLVQIQSVIHGHVMVSMEVQQV